MWAGFFAPETILRKLGLSAGSGDVADFGCGYGTFAIPAAKITRGIVHAIDIEQKMIAVTRAKAKAEGLLNLRVCQRDFMVDGTGLTDASVGYCLVFNILHCEEPTALLREAWRILAPGGTLAIMHWNYSPETPRGPNLNIRPRPEQCREWAVEAGFAVAGDSLVDLPPYHYGLLFRKPC